MYDIIIIGSGPAGLSAALYAGRASMSALVVEKMFSGGQAATTFEIDNYPGFDTPVGGAELAMKMDAQARKFGAEFKNETVTSLSLDSDVKIVRTTKNEYKTKTVILAMGASPAMLGLDKEQRFRGRGVSYCATCDGGFYKDKKTVVIGGGDTALEDALYLSRICRKVYLVHRREDFRANASLQRRVKETANIELVMSSEAVSILGDNSVEGISVKNNITGEISDYEADGLFIAVGTIPNSELVKDASFVDDRGYIVTDENMSTDVKGVYAAGDIRKKPLRQIVTAASDGAVAVYAVQRYLEEV